MEQEHGNSNLNARPMKPKPQKASMATGGSDEDDPAGIIPRPQDMPEPTRKNVTLDPVQMPEQVSMSTQCDDQSIPVIDTSEPRAKFPILTKEDQQTRLTSQMDEEGEEITAALLGRLEAQMTAGMSQDRGNGLDNLMAQFSQISTTIVRGRKEIEKKADEKDEELKASEQVYPKQQVQAIPKRQPREWEEGPGDGSKSQTQEEINAMKHNHHFETYYQGLQLVSAQEWQRFYDKLKEPLDVCFRLNSVDKHVQRTHELLEKHIATIRADPAMAGKHPEPVKWYPNGLAYSFNEVGRLEMRKAPAFKNFHRFLVNETENGRLFRQEKVSMIPVTLLDIKPQHKCLDMCAAPGSKTIQMLEAIHQGKEAPTGFVVANDTDMKRAYMLTHQARRLNSPALMIVNNDARFFPNLRVNELQQNLKFDRILCDVPCSGDGTLRKNYGLWRNFHSHMGHGLHPLQLEILERGLKLLKTGGRLVYSTCSFNPLENEAVVMAALTRNMKQIQLVDVSKEVSPHLRYRPGLINWKVYHRGKGKREKPEWYTNFANVPQWRRKIVKESMFNSTYTQLNNEPERQIRRTSDMDLRDDPLNLKRCMRFFPHDDNQGGFFVAVFEKLLDTDDGLIMDSGYKKDAWNNPKVRQREIKDELADFVGEIEELLGDSVDAGKMEELKSMVEPEGNKQAKKEPSLNDQLLEKKVEEEKNDFPYALLADSKPELPKQLSDFFGIGENFDWSKLAYQKDTNKFVIILNKGLRELMDYTRKNKMKVVNFGHKIFQVSRNKDCKVDFRILQEGLDVLLPHMDERRVVPVKKEVFSAFKDKHDHMLTFEELSTAWKLERFSHMPIGSAVITFDDFAAAIWVGKNNVSLMINKEEIHAMQALMNLK